MRYKSRTRALAASALAASLGLAGLAFTASPAMATEDTDVVRVAGTTRYGTAADAATSAYPAGSANVVLASGEKFPDALAGGGLAGSLDAPILLTQEGNLPADTIAALAELDAETVTILGGTDAISAAVEAELVALGYGTDRVAGLDRFETAADIAAELGGTTAVLANGLRFPDALAISPGAHALELPVLLTLADDLHEDAAAYIDANAVDTVVIVGGTAVVSQDIEDALEADGITVVRLAGDTRYESSIEIAEFHVTQGFTLDEVVMATGENFADALAGGPYASVMGAPMVLTQTATLTPSVATWMAENCQEIDALSILGGTAAITQSVEDAAAAAAQCDVAAGTATTRPELVSATIVDTVTAGEASPTVPAGTYVAYTFDENIDLFAADVSAFQLYNSDGSLDQGAATAVSVDGNTAIAYFAGIATDADAATLTLATVVEGAVTDDQNQDNPEGAAGIGSNVAPGTALPAGITSGPDLVSVGNFRQGANLGETAVDFTFDEAATQVAAAPAADTFFLVQTNGTLAQCEGPGEDGDAIATSGGTVAGGDGTTTFTVICTNPGISGTSPNGTPLTTTNVARGVVDGGEVQDAGANANVQQAADVAGTSADPDLVSITLQPSAGTTPDGILAVFDENVTDAIDVTDVFAYGIDGSLTAATAFDVNEANRTQVLFLFPDMTIDAAGAEVIGLTIEDDAVVASDDATGNQEDEVGVANQTTGTQTVGATAAPQLVSVALSTTTDLFGNVTGVEAAYTFDEAVDAGAIDPADFFLYLADGTKLTASVCVIDTNDTATTADDVTVNCTAFGAATNAQILSATLGTVTVGAVNELVGALDNPEGAAVTTGGTGTPAN